MSIWKRNAGLVTLCTLIIGVSTSNIGGAAAAPAPTSLKALSSAVAADQFDLGHLSTKRVFDPAGLGKTLWTTSPAQTSRPPLLASAAGPTRGIVRLQASSGRSVVADLTGATEADPSLRVMWAASREGVDLSWAALSGVSEYRVSRAGKLLAVVRGTTYRDQGVLPGTNVQYIVESVNPANAPANFPGRTWGLSVSVPKTSASDAVGMQAAAVKQAAAVAVITGSTAVYETFIPQPYIAVPLAGCSYRGGYFGHDFTGDNRGWGSSPFASYKTKSIAYYNWLRGTLTPTNYVGASHVVNHRTKKLVATKTAPNSGMSVTLLSKSSTRVAVAFRIKAVNPFCTGFPKNSIEAYFDLAIYKSGSFTLYKGWHKLMPNHQLWMTTTNPTNPWHSVYRRGLRHESCLLDIPNPVCRTSMFATGRY